MYIQMGFCPAFASQSGLLGYNYHYLFPDLYIRWLHFRLIRFFDASSLSCLPDSACMNGVIIKSLLLIQFVTSQNYTG